MPDPDRRLIEAIDDLVAGDDGFSFREKRDRILEKASDDERTSIFEFASWFDTEAEGHAS